MSQQPRIIAALVRSTLQDVSSVNGDLSQRVRDALEPATLKAIEGASRLSWLPVEVDIQLTESLFTLAGGYQAKQILRGAMSAAVDSPLLRPLLQSALRLHGTDVPRLIAWAPRVWALVYRNCGSLRVEATGHGAVLHLDDLPEAICRSDVYLTGTNTTIDALFRSLDVDAAVRLDGPYLERRTASFQIRWAKAAS